MADRTAQRATVTSERRPPVSPTVQRRAAAIAPSPTQALRQRLGNQGTQALLARTSRLAESSTGGRPFVSAGIAQATPAAAPTPVVSTAPAPVPPTPPPAVQAPTPAAGQSRDQAVPSETPESPAVKITPKSAKEDPAFQKVIQQTRRTKEGLKQNKGAEVKKQELKDASHLPVNDQSDYNDRKQHLETINQTAASHKDAKQVFTAKQFKTLLEEHLKTLEEKLPHSEADAARFKRDKPLEKIKSDVSQEVTKQNQEVAAPISAETQKAEPPKSGVETTVPKDLVAEKPGPTPRPIDPVAAAPKPLQDSEISLEKESKSLDELMAKNNNTEEQFAESNEPKFQKALQTKKDAQEKAAAAPQQYRGQEKRILAGAQKGALQHGSAALDSMFQTRGSAFGEVNTKQSQTEKDDKSEQARIKTELERIYNGTKTDVETIFSELSTYVDETFNTESTAAKTAFEDRVEKQLDDIHGWGVSDFLFGEDTEEIEAVFVAEKQRFLSAMDTTLNTIAQRIADDLNRAVTRIEEGKNEAETFYKGLDKEQQRLSGEAMETFRVQFANLESSVKEKQTELAHSLAESYKQNRDSLRATFVKINEECRKTWIQKAAEFIKEIALTIYRLGELLVTVLVRIAGLIGDILAHPIRFLENLAAGIKQGFKTFADNFDTYLIDGFFEWLRGKVGGAGIKVPAKLDTAGLFSLALQVIGLTYDNFRRIAAQKLGEPVVALIEKGVEGAQEVYKLLQMAREDIGAFWTHIKGVLADSVDEIFEKIKKTVLYETIKKVLAYIVTLFNPVGAFIKAAQAIYAGIRFLMDNIDRIVALVNAFLDGVEMAVKGNVSGIAAKVIFGLKNAIVMGIDFLAKLLGLGNLADKVRSIIKQLSSPVERAMGFVVDKVLKPVARLAAKGVKGLVAKGKAGVRAIIGWWNAKTSFKAGSESHSLYFRGEGPRAKLVLASNPLPVEVFLVEKAAGAKGDKTKQNAVKAVRVLLDKVDKLTATASQGKTEDEKLQKEIERLMNEMGEHLVKLLSDDEWGTEANPAAFDYPKRRAEAYPTFYLATGLLTSLDQNQMQAQFPAQGGNKSGQVYRYRPTELTDAPDKSAKIGLAAGSQVEVGRKVFFRDKEARGSGVRRFKNLVDKFGFVASQRGWDIDHVVELQIGGKDEYDNMWPLPKGENRSSGSIIKNATIEIPATKDQKPMRTALEEKKKGKKPQDGLWLLIKSTRQL